MHSPHRWSANFLNKGPISCPLDFRWDRLWSVGVMCPIIGVSGGNSAPSLVSVGGMVPHHWCQWEE
ncbi:unnamed protein product [Staurois parvus]|uniref:Uncharacterized protein n=1 Tax=Staurois parvus TaxID=386267 RepID=A0ABN9EGN7_9NEOB|nr:unnamed protein product [Staurois parvus]